MRQIRRFQPTLLPESKNLLPMCFVGLSIFVGLQTMLVIFLSVKVNDLATRKTTFVQLVDGRAVAIREEAGTYRTPDLVKNVARQWTILTWTWDSKLPGTSKPDAGQKIGSNRLPTTAYLASFLLQGKTKSSGSSFREESRKAIAELTPAGVFSGNTCSTILISYVSEPRTIAPGRYEIDMVATRNVIDQSGQIEEIPFNRTFTLEAVDIPRSPLGKDATDVERAVYNVREAGLEITDIKPFNPNQP
ncbi:MAG: hypothetical protein NW224_16720 [Leptolyngbyaceae cyanobacterium bins.302]|nr:hypothetical protein [Leptolyngbyaceae cyanobacterium bins.302]